MQPFQNINEEHMTHIHSIKWICDLNNKWNEEKERKKEREKSALMTLIEIDLNAFCCHICRICGAVLCFSFFFIIIICSKLLESISHFNLKLQINLPHIKLPMRFATGKFETKKKKRNKNRCHRWKSVANEMVRTSNRFDKLYQ